jgi:hypothetical protein
MLGAPQAWFGGQTEIACGADREVGLEPRLESPFVGRANCTRLVQKIFHLEELLQGGIDLGSLSEWRRGPRLNRRPGDLSRPREAARPRLCERGAMERDEDDEPGNGYCARGRSG